MADANIKRDNSVFKEVCHFLMQQAHGKAKGELNDRLRLLDSIPIFLKGLGYNDWTENNKTSRTQGLKVHVVTLPQAEMRIYIDITPPNVNDIDVGKKIELEEGATYVFDKGYCDYSWWFEIDQSQSFFVTRFKKNAGVMVKNNLQIPRDSQASILEDAIVEFKHKVSGGRKRVNYYHGTALRRITVDRPDKEAPLVLVTNDFNRSAEEIASLYKQRWDIELFFKWLKQNLRIKKFIGRSENAVRIQIYTATQCSTFFKA